MSQNGWLLLDEMTPRDRLIDMWVDGERRANCRFNNGTWVAWSHAVRGVSRWHILNNPTHWMDIPGPP
jgi:hypothetical protein